MALTEALANYIADMRYENIPEQVADLAKMAICDFLGVAMAGRDLEGPRMVKEFVLEQRGFAECSIPGHGFKTSAQLSALLSGTMGHVLDYDDVAFVMRGHSGVIVMPVIWALGDKYNITGKRAIEAFLVGFEVGAYIGKYVMAAKPGAASWHYTKQVGVLCAAATAAKIMGLTVAQTRVALGIAGSMSGGLKQNFGTMSKSLHAGLAAHDGIVAAMFAKKGFTADMNIIEAEQGLRSAFQSGEPPTEEVVIDMINSGFWDITSGGGIGFKMHPACYGGHNAMDAAIQLAERENINPDDVESILVEASESSMRGLFHHDPKTGLEGKFSLEFCVAVALSDRKAGLAQFTDERVPSLVPLMKKVKLKSYEKLVADRENYQKVEITMKDGRVFTNTCEYPFGHPDNPVSWDGLLDKYRECVSLHFPQEDVAKSEEILVNLEKMEQFRELVTVFAK